MCGICGIIDTRQTLPKGERDQLVQAMNTALIHRGPDEGGSYSDGFASLAMRRLSIIDESSGKQPIYNEDQTICVVYNGEIYNFKELRQSLQQKNHQFKTASDTEVLVHLYEEYGTEMLPMLKGMFAFCLYDSREKKYLLARDRFGEKPLYYHWNKKTFTFSSEIKSLLENSRIDRRLNAQALPYYFRTAAIPEPMTLLNEVYSLQPGHYLILTNESLEDGAYFKPSTSINDRLTSDEAAMEFIEPHLLKAVQRQTISDVPIGAFLSGGIDSSSIVALLQSQQSEQLKTFNVRFEDQEYDESPIARKVAKHCGTDHRELFIPNMDFEETIFWKIIDHVGFPFRDSSAIQAYFISEAIAKEVKVALSGDGGDELFGGYAVYQWYLKIRRFKSIPAPLRSALQGGLNVLSAMPGFGNSSVLRKIKRGVGTSLVPTAELPIALNEMFARDRIPGLFNGLALDMNANEYPAYPGLADNIDWKAASPLREIMNYRLRHTLPVNMLCKVDRMSMANSLEVRAPFLDPDLFDAASQLPDRFLIRDGQGKYILRKIMPKHLPAEVFDHPKQGFNIPLFKYQNKSFKDLAQRLLFDENPWPDLIKKDELKKIYDQGISTVRSTASQSVFQSSHQLWMMMQLFGWAKRFNINI